MAADIPMINVSPTYTETPRLDTTKLQPRVSMYGPGATGKTSMLIALLRAYPELIMTYVDTDWNLDPFKGVEEEVMCRIKYFGIKDSINHLNIPLFFEQLCDSGITQVCSKHHYVNCPACDKGGEWAQFQIPLMRGHLLVVDSLPTTLDSVLLQVKKDIEPEKKQGQPTKGVKINSKTSFNHFGAQATRTMNVLHLMKIWQGPSLLITDALDLNSSLEGKNPKRYYPNFGTKNFSQAKINRFGAILHTVKGKPGELEYNLTVDWYARHAEGTITVPPTNGVEVLAQALNLKSAQV